MLLSTLLLPLLLSPLPRLRTATDRSAAATGIQLTIGVISSGVMSGAEVPLSQQQLHLLAK